jgi:hypothetical protein
MRQTPAPDLDSGAVHDITSARLEEALPNLPAIHATGATSCPSASARTMASA